MPPKIKVTKEDIMDGALRIVRERGINNLNARDLAKEIGCSVHPIFREYTSMEGLKLAVYKAAEDIYNQRMLIALDNPDDGFLGVGLTYINFAKDEQNLFQLLFMSDAFREQSMMDIVAATEGDEDVIHMLCQRTGLNEKSAQELYAGVWLTAHGIASMFATNNCRFSDEENRRLLNNSFMGLIFKLKKEEEQH